MAATGREAAAALLDARHENLVLALGELQEDPLGGNEIGYAFAGHLRQDFSRGGANVGELLAHGVHGVGILPHHQIEKDPLSGEETLRSLPDPIRQEDTGENSRARDSVCSGRGLPGIQCAPLLHCSI